jgi:hypothetical protein
LKSFIRLRKTGQFYRSQCGCIVAVANLTGYFTQLDPGVSVEIDPGVSPEIDPVVSVEIDPPV